MAVRIRMKRMGRTHRPFYRICAIDKRSPRDGRVIEELGHYDPMCKETDARALLKNERIDYWIGVGAQPSTNVKVLIKKYGTSGTHLEQQAAAQARLKVGPQAPAPVAIPLPKKEEPAAEAPAADAATETAKEEKPAEAKAEEKPAKEEKPAEEKPAEDKPAEGASE